MKVKLEKVTIQTKKPMEAINITPKVKKIVEQSSIKNGLVNIISLHTSAGIAVTEGLSCLEEDIFFILDRLVPKEGDYHHARYLDSYGRLGINAHAHLKSILTGMSAFFPIQDGKMVISGTQTIYFLEFDGPLYRTFCVQILGE